ncbi:uncharacterized protein LOC108929999 [Scleropages formosus]|uniref:uncharacterized protein LOC108929999 n=1 Tax=Scleropages formosus TaxID=113540 RepID=UPI000878E949|nr:uncharacterized protein LOC108929999 [Scleropages formosus]
MGGYRKHDNIRTLNSVADLSGVSFGHKYPRHGLLLLHWLAKGWIWFNTEGKMMAARDPAFGDFGFHLFHNKEQILPPLKNQSQYFEVGNFHAPGASALPFSQAQTGSDKSNTDRIIVRMDPGCVVAEVYITEHVPHLNSFGAHFTYRVSRGLIGSVARYTPESFLQQAGYIGRAIENRETVVEMEEPPVHEAPSRPNRICSCIIL